MKPIKRNAIAISLAGAFAALLTLQYVKRDNTPIRIIPMIEGCATTIHSDHEAFPEDILAVETAWGTPIPDDFVQIGGIDWFGWAKICRDDQDAPGVFRGEYRDLAQRYVGMWRIVDPQNRPLSKNILMTYQMSHFSENRMMLRNFNGEGDDFLFLEPVMPSDIESSQL